MGYFDFDFPHTHFYESDLREILKYVRKLVKAVSEIDGWVETHEEEYKELKKIVDDIYNGTLTPALEESLKKWVDTNLKSLIGNAIKHVYFGLTNDGYFCAYIPDNWSDIQFDTVNDYDDPLYGHLMLMYD